MTYIEDGIFGKLQYEDQYTLIKNEELKVFGKNINVELVIDTDKNGKISIEQYCNYYWIKDDWHKIEKKIKEKVFKYYKEKYEYLKEEYKDNIDDLEELNERYGNIQSADEITDLIELLEIRFKHVTNFDFIEYEIGLIFNCEWEPGDGLGIAIRNKEITNIGWEDII